jgi:DNA polymerase-3 subunit gamma/tau
MPKQAEPAPMPAMSGAQNERPVAAVVADDRWHSNDLLTGCGDAWGELIAASGIGGRLRQLALHACRGLGDKPDDWVLVLPNEYRHLVSDKAIAALTEAFSTHLGETLKIRVELDEPSQPTPAKIEQQRYAQLLAEAHDSLMQDPHIQFLIQRFGAQLDADSIQPLKH